MSADEDCKHEPEHDHLLDHEFSVDSFDEDEEGDHDPFADEFDEDD